MPRQNAHFVSAKSRAICLRNQKKVQFFEDNSVVAFDRDSKVSETEHEITQISFIFCGRFELAAHLFNKKWEGPNPDKL
jgi:hypothetical protein